MNHEAANKNAPTRSAKAAPITSILRLLAPPWRLGGNVRSADEKTVEGLSDGAIAAEWGFAVVVILGVVLELWSPVRGDVLVAGGIAGEVLASMVAHKCSSELLTRSNDSLAELWFWRGFAETTIEQTETNLADAQRKLAGAIERAANAELETEKLRKNLSWRRLSKSEKEILLSDLSKACGPVLIVYGMGDFESESYALQFAAIFTLAKWAPVMRAVQFDWLAFGLRAPPLEGDPMNQPAKTLRAALTAAGMEFENDSLPYSGMARTKNMTAGRRFAENPAELFVGPKEYPYAWPEDPAETSAR